jgi:hypothetical protein
MVAGYRVTFILKCMVRVAKKVIRYVVFYVNATRTKEKYEDGVPNRKANIGFGEKNV